MSRAERTELPVKVTLVSTGVITHWDESMAKLEYWNIYAGSFLIPVTKYFLFASLTLCSVRPNLCTYPNLSTLPELSKEFARSKKSENILLWDLGIRLVLSKMMMTVTYDVRP